MLTISGYPEGGVGVVFVGISDQMCGPKNVLELYNAPHDQSERLALRFKHAWCFLPQRYASWPYLMSCLGFRIREWNQSRIVTNFCQMQLHAFPFG